LTKDGGPIEPTDYVVAVATIKIEDVIATDEDGHVIVPELPRTQCEHAIELFANSLAVCSRTNRTISSLDPCVAFSEIPELIQKQLDASKGFLHKPRATARVPFEINFADPSIHGALTDRYVGVAIMAESLSATNTVAKYRELLLLFENAFARPSTDLRKKLFSFLDGASLGYTREEVGRWINMRHGSFHADMLKSKTLVFESDVAPFIARMEQAAYDVLFNKEKWHDSNVNRREVMIPLSGTTNNTHDLRMTKGQDFRVQVQLYDTFGVYPMNLAQLTSPPPNWWHRSTVAKIISSASLEVR
jgi:hypothetical protein